MVQRIAVVGGGVVGVCTAMKVVESCSDVTVHLISEKFSPETTGDGAAGLISPYLIQMDENTLKSWCADTFEFLRSIFLSAEAPDMGVGLISCYNLTNKTPVILPFADSYPEYRLMTEKELQLFSNQYKHGIFFTSYYVECAKFLPKLMDRFEKKGGTIITEKVTCLKELAGRYDIVVNCTGLNASTLVPDPLVRPLRGQVIRVRAPWIKHTIMDDDFHIIPNSEEVILGGTRQEGDWNTHPDPVDRERIWAGCNKLLPSIKNAEVIRDWVGLRPGRHAPRLEKETLCTEKGDLQVIHNYGHGGSGVTLAWGCATHVLRLIKQILAPAST